MKAKSPKTNKMQILNHLLGQKHISQLEALGVYRCFRLSAVIHELRKEGYNVLSHWSVDATGKRYKRYYLAKKLGTVGLVSAGPERLYN